MTDPKIITSPTEVNYHRKVTLKDADIDTNTKGKLEAMCKDCDKIISKHMTDIDKTDLVQMSLQPKDNVKPFNQNQYTLPLRHHAWLRQELTDLEKAGIIFPSTANFASPVIIVPKKKDPGTYKIIYRMVVDFRKMNEQLEYWFYPLMCIDRIFSKLKGSNLFSTFNVRSGYYNITVAEDSRQYTAFTTEYGKYESLKSPFWHPCSTQLFWH